MTDWLDTWREARSTVEVTCCGECLIELSQYDGSAQSAALKFAGDTCNTAVYLARALQDSATVSPITARVSFATALGEDGFSQGMIKGWQAEGIGLNRVLRDPDRLPGIYAVELDASGERSFRYWRDQSAAREMFANGDGVIAGSDVVYLSGITLAVIGEIGRAQLFAGLSKIKQAGGLILFDSNYRPRLWPSAQVAKAAYDQALALSDVALLSDEDLVPLYGSVEAAPTGAIREVIVRTGGPQLTAFLDGAALSLPPLPNAEVVRDTTGAGDSFNGAYVAARLRGAALPDAIVAGHSLALKVIAQPGAIIPRD